MARARSITSLHGLRSQLSGCRRDVRQGDRVARSCHVKGADALPLGVLDTLAGYRDAGNMERRAAGQRRRVRQDRPGRRGEAT